MMKAQPKTHGITGSLSDAMPTEKELSRTESLRQVLEKFKCIDTAQQREHRQVVIRELLGLVKKWVHDVLIKKGKPEQVAKEAGGVISVFGSYRVGVNDQAGDVDTLMVVPRDVGKDEFFTSWYAVLEELSKGDKPKVKDLHAAPGAYVPIIKLEFMNVEIDLLLCRLAQDKVPDDIDLDDVELIRNVDQKCVLALNGTRVTNRIISLVPHPDNFRMAVRTVKLWAKSRAIYGNVFGYPTGVAWLMMMARVCQFYPNACPSTLMTKFFFVYSGWQWPNPVMLVEQENLSVRPDMPQWDPRVHENERADLMPVITPAYPSINSTYNVIESTHFLIKKEFGRGKMLLAEINAGKTAWEKLWEPSTFFSDSSRYIVIKAEARSKNDLVAYEAYDNTPLTTRAVVVACTPIAALHVGVVQSSIRKFVEKLCHRNERLLALPYPKGFEGEVETIETADGDQHIHSIKWYVSMGYREGMEPAKGETVNIVLDSAIKSFNDDVYFKASRPMDQNDEDSYMWKEGMEQKISLVKRKDLPDCVFPNGVRPPKKPKDGKRKAKAKAKAAGESSLPVEEADANAASPVQKRVKREPGETDGAVRNSNLLSHLTKLLQTLENYPTNSVTITASDPFGAAAVPPTEDRQKSLSDETLQQFVTAVRSAVDITPAEDRPEFEKLLRDYGWAEDSFANGVNHTNFVDKIKKQVGIVVGPPNSTGGSGEGETQSNADTSPEPQQEPIKRLEDVSTAWNTGFRVGREGGEAKRPKLSLKLG